MANLDAPSGFLPVRHLRGGIVRYDGGYTIASGETTAMFQGDAVSLDATPAGDGNNIQAAGITGEVLGIFAGCQYVAANGDVVWSNQWVGSTATLGAAPAEAFVYTDPSIVFSVQVDGTIDNTDIGAFAPLVAGAGNAATGISGFELNATTGVSPNQFRIIGVAGAPDGIFVTDLASANPRVEVQIAQSPFIADV